MRIIETCRFPPGPTVLSLTPRSLLFPTSCKQPASMARFLCLLHSFPGSAWERIVLEAPASRVHKRRMHFGEAEPRLH